MDSPPYEFQYTNLLLDIRWHPEGCELRFEQDPETQAGDLDIQSFALVLSRDDLEILHQAVQRFLDHPDRLFL